MDKTFDPQAVESRVAAGWREEDAFRAGRPERAGAEPFTMVIPPPNVTGALHMGHALNTTLQDILCRFERMRGKDVLWQPGTDHAGIATQMVVERQLMERQQPGRREMGREKFLERVWEWKAESGGVIVNQLKRLGASCDWSRERFTMDEGLSRAVVKVFVQLYKEGLIYKDKRLVNWDPQLQTAISDLEVVQVETKGHLWHFKYPIVDDAEAETGEFIVVATTRPETMLGDTAVAVHPTDERYLHLHGRRVRLPLVGRLIPIVADEYSDPEKGTGAVKITPAHDFNDFEVGKRHEAEGVWPVNILDAHANLDLATNDDFREGVADNAVLNDTIARLNGSNRFAARELIVEMMEARGLVERIEPHPHMVPHGDRSGVVIEPWLTDQWYVKAEVLAQPALAAVRDGKTSFVPQNWEKTYFDWLENIQPWCISRQLWWGHQIPAWYGFKIVPDGQGGVTLDHTPHEIFVAESEEEAQRTAEQYYSKVAGAVFVTSSATHALAQLTNDQKVRLDKGEKWDSLPIWRDPDVLDTWFSSALWPFSTLGWPDETPELKRHYPTNVLVTGFDIIFFWVARMMMMGLHFQGEVPFRDVYIHPLVRDEKGAKMSKSKGNVIDPLNLIDQYGADSLRFTLAAMAAQGRDIKLSTQRVEGYRNFATKLWNAARFAEMNGCVRVENFDRHNVAITLNRWIIGETAKAVNEVTGAIEAYRFNDAANAAYRFVWNIFCDWYLELGKPLLQGADGPEKDETRATAAFVLDEIVKLLHPFMPFITEELWAIKGAEGAPRASLLALAPWPNLEGCENPAAEAEVGWLLELVSEVRSVRAEMNVPAGAQIPLTLVAAGEEITARAKRWDEPLRRLARLSEVSFAAEAPEKSVQVIVRGSIAALPLQGIIDFDAEKSRLAKEIAKLLADAKKTEAKLGNADFVARAPEEVVAENRERLAEALARADKLGSALSKLS
ncbi:valine--tRNA ligase [Methylocapsa palsarum]|uniref:Valine--tRNA ligase n=1 Tax=Methylocapsa palsarum TaxID=1612308 RepID=A0A1I3XTW3_9HYPH|nr:valine--tRNA ligase [Methylocapsa palsarum]SFK22923.1 valyl-tRNA synthetase [Methylocapsa palsarum]